MQTTTGIASKYGAQLLLRGKFEENLNMSGAPHHLIVAARFPSMEHLKNWQTSQEYKEIVPLREEASNQLMIAYNEI